LLIRHPYFHETEEHNANGKRTKTLDQYIQLLTRQDHLATGFVFVGKKVNRDT